jgi:hypothetical protein
VNFGDQARPPRAALAQMQQPCCTLKSLDSPSRRQNLGRARRVERKPHPLRGAALHRRPSHRRRYDLSFRAATAVFGHLGIEWDLTAATAQELADLREWVSFYKANRWLLMGGALVRVDSPDPTVMAYGIIAADRSEAIYTIASVGRSEVMFPGRLRFPGLDPDRRYRIRPILVGRAPSGLNPPPWWEPSPRSSSRLPSVGPSGGVCLLTAATVSYYLGQCWASPAAWLPTCIPIMRSSTARRHSTDAGRWPYWGQAVGAG